MVNGILLIKLETMLKIRKMGRKEIYNQIKIFYFK